MNEQWPLYTIIIMIVLFTSIVGIDIYLAYNKAGGDTFSAIIKKMAAKWSPIIMMTTFGMGLLAGHWFW